MKTPKFKPHTNRELLDERGRPKKYYSERDYRADMKKAGLEPYNPANVSKTSTPAYARSDWAREMHRTAIESKGKVGDRFYRELEKRGYTKERLEQARRLANER